MNDDVSFLLPGIVGLGWAGSRAILRLRSLQVAGALSGAGARAEPPSVVLVCMEFSIGARVPLLSLLLQATVHLPVSPQLLLKLLNCQWKLLQRKKDQVPIHSISTQMHLKSIHDDTFIYKIYIGIHKTDLGSPYIPRLQ